VYAGATSRARRICAGVIYSNVRREATMSSKEYRDLIVAEIHQAINKLGGSAQPVTPDETQRTLRNLGAVAIPKLRACARVICREIHSGCRSFATTRASVIEILPGQRLTFSRCLLCVGFGVKRCGSYGRPT
jgi:hypothetical protein